MKDAAAMSPEDAEAAMLEGLLAGVEKTRASIAALEALELNLLATARQIAADRTAYDERAAAAASEMSVNRLRPILRRLAEQAQQRPLTERHREARAHRG